MDSRFKHVAKDPRFKPVHGRDVKINSDDDRFKNLFSSSAVKNIVDARGRKFNPKGIQEKYKKDIILNNKSQSNEGICEDGGGVDKFESESKEYDQDSDEESNNETTTEYEDLQEDEALVNQMNKDINSKDVTADTHSDGFRKRMSLIKDEETDYLRGAFDYSGSSSSDDSSSDDEEETNLHNWAELDKEADWDVDGNSVEETSRIAVCNLDWDRFTAQDILMVLNSFTPVGGKVCKISIYMSEFGKKRLAEESVKGPSEVADLPLTKEEEDEEDNCETVRKYHFNKLKYYYAVAECNSIDAAVAIYKSVDGTNFKNGGIVDLRYIPSDMTFDEAPQSECTSIVGSYNGNKATVEGFADSNLTKSRFTWDEDEERIKTLRKFTDAESAYNDPALAQFLASDEDSDDAANEYDGVFTSYFDEEEEEKESKEDRIKKFKFFVNNIDEASVSKDTEEKLLKRGINGDSDISDGDETDEQSDDETKGLTHFEKYLLKRKKKQKEYRKKKKEKESGGPRKPKESDWDIPDDLKNDPFFKSELELRRKEKLIQDAEERKIKDQEFARKELEKQQREKDMALLMLNDGEDEMHVNMREVVKEAKKEALGGKKKLSKWQMTRQKQKEKRLAREGVFIESTKSIATAPVKPPCNLKDVIEDNRFANIINIGIERSHPEYSKHQTPFMEGLSQALIEKNLTGPKNEKVSSGRKRKLNSADAQVCASNIVNTKKSKKKKQYANI